MSATLWLDTFFYTIFPRLTLLWYHRVLYFSTTLFSRQKRSHCSHAKHELIAGDDLNSRLNHHRRRLLVCRLSLCRGLEELSVLEKLSVLAARNCKCSEGLKTQRLAGELGVALGSPLLEAHAASGRGHPDHQGDGNVGRGAENLSLVHDVLLEQLEAHLLVQTQRGGRRFKVQGQLGPLAQFDAPLAEEGAGLLTLVLGVDGDDVTV